MEAKAADWLYDELHADAPYHDGSFSNWSKTRTEDTPYHYRDGVNIWAADVDLDPDDRFLSPGEQHKPEEAGDEGQPGDGEP